MPATIIRLTHFPGLVLLEQRASLVLGDLAQHKRRVARDDVAVVEQQVLLGQRARQHAGGEHARAGRVAW